jgi:hypothetical protein
LLCGFLFNNTHCGQPRSPASFVLLLASITVQFLFKQHSFYPLLNPAALLSGTHLQSLQIPALLYSNCSWGCIGLCHPPSHFTHTEHTPYCLPCGVLWGFPYCSPCGVLWGFPFCSPCGVLWGFLHPWAVQEGTWDQRPSSSDVC